LAPTQKTNNAKVTFGGCKQSQLETSIDMIDPKQTERQSPFEYDVSL
jgi:hypothetical protein